LSDKINILFQDCDPTVANDKKLPTSAFLVEYLQDGLTKFDIVTSYKQVDIFDHYWDNYREDFKGMSQAKGTTNPKLYGVETKKTEKKKKS
tara:strand:+ start:159 stop:431 length:273 start_codon:yes stop_codon:yes gene_type:complete